MQPLLTSDTSSLLIRPRGALALSGLMYLTAALHPVILAEVGWPSMEVAWFAMLIPTVVLSFYWGRWGALASVLIALALYPTVEWLSHDVQFIRERALFGASVILAIISLAIGIGELAELLRREYVGRVNAERAAATSELAVALKHELYNPLAALLAEIELLQEESASLPEEQRESIGSAAELARRIRTLVDRAAELDQPERVQYLEGRWMTDLSEF